MTVRDLIDRLSEVDPDATLRIAFQPSWPLAADVAGVADADDLHGGGAIEEDDVAPADVVWLVAAAGVGYDVHPYAPRGAWDAAR